MGEMFNKDDMIKFIKHSLGLNSSRLKPVDACAFCGVRKSKHRRPFCETEARAQGMTYHVIVGFPTAHQWVKIEKPINWGAVGGKGNIVYHTQN